MRALALICPNCHAEPGAKCRDVGVGDEARTKTGHHVSRVRRAHYATLSERAAKHASDKATDAVIDELKRST